MGIITGANYDYQTAVSSLYSQIDPKMRVDAREQTVPEMREYMRRIGLSYNSLNYEVIHVTGTKGKGSVCAFTESILRNAHKAHTGMFTSPHLLHVNERIRLDGKPINNGEFADAYFSVREVLLTASRDYKDVEFQSLPSLPGYFRMLTLMALFVFAHHKFDNGMGIDVAIIEVGIGGRFDATNVLDNYAACCIARLDLDHTNLLGDTLEKIAWEKGGIIKSSCGPAFTVDCNTDGSIDVLRRCADDVAASLHIITVGSRVKLGEWNLGLKGDHQIINAELALSLCEAFMAHNEVLKDRQHAICLDTVYSLVKDAFDNTFWPGRCQFIRTSRFQDYIHIYLDGAHTLESISCCLNWFVGNSGFHKNRESMVRPKRILIFNCGHERNPVDMLKHIVLTRQHEYESMFDDIYFCSAKSERPSTMPRPTAQALLEEAGMINVQSDDGSLPSYREASSQNTWQETLSELWRYLDRVFPCKKISCLHVGVSIEEVFNIVHKDAVDSSVPADVCVMGSLYLAGSVLQVLEWDEEHATGQIVR